MVFKISMKLPEEEKKDYLIHLLQKDAWIYYYEFLELERNYFDHTKNEDFKDGCKKFRVYFIAFLEGVWMIEENTLIEYVEGMRCTLNVLKGLINEL